MRGSANACGTLTRPALPGTATIIRFAWRARTVYKNVDLSESDDSSSASHALIDFVLLNVVPIVADSQARTSHALDPTEKFSPSIVASNAAAARGRPEHFEFDYDAVRPSNNESINRNSTTSARFTVRFQTIGGGRGCIEDIPNS